MKFHLKDRNVGGIGQLHTNGLARVLNEDTC